MLSDPVDAFFSGFSSAGRTVLGLGSIFVGALLWMFVKDMRSFTASDLWLAAPMCLFHFAELSFFWFNYGWFWIVGCMSVIAMLGFLWTFVFDSRSQLSLFGCLTASAVYFSPIAIHYGYSQYDCSRNALVGLILFGLISLCYWTIPSISSAIAERRYATASCDGEPSNLCHSEHRGAWFWTLFVSLAVLLTLVCLNSILTYAIGYDRFCGTPVEYLLWSICAAAIVVLLTVSPFFFRRLGLLPIIGWTFAMIALVLLLIRFVFNRPV